LGITFDPTIAKEFKLKQGTEYGKYR
jgi:hypothetical protein